MIKKDLTHATRNTRCCSLIPTFCVSIFKFWTASKPSDDSLGLLPLSDITTWEAKPIINVDFSHCHHINLSDISSDFQKCLKSLKMFVYDVSGSRVKTGKHLCNPQDLPL